MQKEKRGRVQFDLDLLHSRDVALTGLVAPAVTNPLAPPTIASGTVISVDYALQHPTEVITPMLIDMTLARFLADRCFASAGGVTGGAVIYNIVEGNDLYAARDVQKVAPGEEFPVIDFKRRGIEVASVEKWGGKFPITWEARDRNNHAELVNATRQLANTIVRKLNQDAVTKLEAMIAANTRTASGNDWSAVTTVGSAASNHDKWPAYDFGQAAETADEEEMGIVYNLWIMNPQEYANLASIYGNSLSEVLTAHGISIFVTNRIAKGSAYAVAEGQVGEMRVEQPLMTRTFPDGDGIEQDWVQSSVRPLCFANNPFAILKFTGLAG